MPSVYRVNIEGEEAQTTSRITLNKILIDLNDLTRRGIAVTNSLKLPPTNQNNRLLGNPNRLSSDNDSFESQKNYVLQDDSTTVSTGKVVVKEYDPKKGSKIQLAEGFDFWSAAGSKLLNDLVLNDFDFVFTTVNMNSRKTKGSDIFITALHSATGEGTNTALVNYAYTRPVYYWKRLLDLIVEDLGYSIDYGNVLTLTELNSLGNLSNAEKFFVSDYKIRFQNVAQSGDIDYSSSDSVFLKSSRSTTQSGANLLNSTYKTSYVLKGTITSVIDTEIVLSSGDRISVSQGTSFINYRTDELEIGSTFKVSFSDDVTLDDFYIYAAINEADIFEVSGTINVSNYLVLADYNLPNQTYKQFIKNILSLQFVDFEVDNDKKEILARYLPDNISTNNVLDFSSKVKRNAPFQGGKTYGQLSVFSYANDDEINEDFGTAFVNIPNENAPETKSIIHISDYSASNEITVSGNNVVSVNIYNTAENKRESVRDRIIYLEDTGSFGINAVFTRISWQRLYSSHYLNFVTATKRERVFTLEAYLTNTDFNRLKTSPVIYVEWLESTFLVTEITGFEKSTLCKLKVIKYN